MGAGQSAADEGCSDGPDVIELDQDIRSDALESTPSRSPSCGQSDRLSEYRLGSQLLGEGSFGKVLLATSVLSGEAVAVKIIKRNRLKERAEVLLRREVAHHEKLRHPNIVRLHTWIKCPSEYFLVMEYCEAGDLLHYLNERGLLLDDEARRLFAQLMDGVRFCHGLGIFHRDLKLENLMLTRGGSVGGTGDCDGSTISLKIADFGLSDLSPIGLSETYCGSPLYAAPELLDGGRERAGYDASRSDVWSCGVILYALLASALPFDAADMRQLYRLVTRAVPHSPIPSARGEAAAELVSLLLSREPHERPTAAEARAHRWLSEVEARPSIAAVSHSMDSLSLAAPTRDKEGGEVGGESRRRGVTETSEYFRAMLARARQEEEDAEAAVVASLTAGPSMARSSALSGPATPSVEAAADELRKPGTRLTRAELDAIRAEQQQR